MKAGVVAIQGDVSEHVSALDSALRSLSLSGSAFRVRTRAEVESSDVLVLPGGESTTISKLLDRFGLFDSIVKRVGEGMPIMGTCAGCILLAKKGDAQVEQTSTKLLGLMDMKVDRNFFGRQRESFEADLDINGLDKPFKGVFIRAPAIIETWGSCRPMARVSGKIAMAKQDNMLGLIFHPELSGSDMLHRLLLEL